MKENQRVKITKRLLLEALIELLKTTPLEKIKIVTLCEKAGINRTTFYRYYSLPKDILDELRTYMLREIGSLVSDNIPAGNLKADLVSICKYCYEHRELLVILFDNRTDDDFIRLLNKFYLQRFPKYLSAMQSQGISSSELKLTSYYYAGGFFYLLRQWIKDDMKITPEAMAELIFSLISGRELPQISDCDVK